MRANVSDIAYEIDIKAPLVKLGWVDSKTFLYMRKKSYCRYSTLFSFSYLSSNQLLIDEIEVFDNSVFVMRLIGVDISAIRIVQKIDLSVIAKKFEKEEKIYSINVVFKNVLLALL